MIPTYNCSKYLKQALESVLIQDPGIEKMQIEVVDDNSTDENVEELVNAIGRRKSNILISNRKIAGSL